MAAESNGKTLAGCIIGLLLIPLMIALRGWVLATLWRWLMTPIFNLHPLTVWQAIGVSVVIGVFSMRVPPKDDEGALEGAIRSTIYAILGYATALLLGYIAAAHI